MPALGTRVSLTSVAGIYVLVASLTKLGQLMAQDLSAAVMTHWPLPLPLPQPHPFDPVQAACALEATITPTAKVDTMIVKSYMTTALLLTDGGASRIREIDSPAVARTRGVA